MADFSYLIGQIEAYVKQNGNNDITGDGLQDILVAMVGTIGGALNDAVSDLESADTTLTNAIGDEEQARQGADNTLGGRITAEEEARAGADTGLQNQINGINGKIPDAASSTNKLADKAFVQGLVDALTASIAAINDKIPSEASSSNKLADKAFVQALTTALQNALNTLNGKVPAAATSENQLADKAFVTSLTTALQNAINTINTNIGNGFVYAGVATPSGTPVSGKVAYLTAQAGTYANYGGLVVPAGISVIKYDGTNWSQEQVISMETIYRNPLMGLYDCDTSGSTVAKTVTAVGYVLPTNGGSMKVRMANHTTVDNVTLNINGTGAKDLYYKGKAAGINNTWDDGAVLNVIYDSSNDRYLSYNANAGTGDGVFDVSEYTGDDYATLEDAIADIPVSEQHGGMEMRFVQSSDNKYTHYNLLADSFTTDTTQWAVDDAGVYINNPEFIEAKTDVDGKLLEARKTNGAKIEYCDLEVKGKLINDEIWQQIDSVKDNFTNIDNIVNNPDNTTPHGYLSEQSNPEWLQATTDSEGRVLGGRKQDGIVKENVGIEAKSVKTDELTFGTSIGQSATLDTLGITDGLQLSNVALNKLKEDLGGSPTGSIIVTLDLENKRVTILSELSSNYDIENSMIWNSDNLYTKNPCLNFGGTSIINKNNGQRKEVNTENDNISPTATNYGWIGANHGLSCLGTYTVTGHDKTYVDIGSKWENGNDVYVLVQIPDENTLSFIPMYSESDGIYSFPSSAIAGGNTLTHVNGATHSENIVLGDKLSTIQWRPSEDIISRVFTLDGKKLTESGIYYGKQLDCCEVYDVFDPASYLDILISAVGTLDHNPLPKEYKDSIRRYIRYCNDFRFTKGGLNVLFEDLIVLSKLSFESHAPLDVKILKSNSLGGSVLQYYLPKAKAITVDGNTYDFRVPADYVVNNGLHWGPNDWENPLLPPDRAIEFVCDENNKRIIGLHHGYIFDQGVASGTNRKSYCNDWWVHTTRASYTGALNSGTQEVPQIMPQYKHYGMVCFRKYDDHTDNPNGLVSLSQFEVNNKYYLYGDFSAQGIFELKIPNEWCGKEIEVFEKSDNVELINSLSASLLMVRVTSANPMYGYLVLGIKD